MSIMGTSLDPLQGMNTSLYGADIDPTTVGMGGIGQGQYKLNTQTNIVMMGYVIIMLLNHLSLAQVVFNKRARVKDTKTVWIFASVIIFTIINCMMLLVLKEKRRPVIVRRAETNIMPIMFTIFQIIILAFTLWLHIICVQPKDAISQFNDYAVYVFINIAAVLSTWGFSLTRCSMGNASYAQATNPMMGNI